MTHVLLLKGMKQDQRHWLGFQDRLAARVGGRVLCLDLPGSGTEAHRLPPARVEGLAEDVRTRWLAARGDDTPWAILGLSLGGMVALAWAAAHPGELSHVIVGNTSSADTARPHERLSWRRWPRLARTLTQRDDVAREHLVLSMTTTALPAHRRAEVAAAFGRFQSERPFTGRAWLRQLTAGGRFRAPAGVSPTPLVLVGRLDRFVSPACSHRLARRLGAELREHPTAGHDLSLDAPDWLAEQVADWLADRPGRSRDDQHLG